MKARIISVHEFINAVPNKTIVFLYLLLFI